MHSTVVRSAGPHVSGGPNGPFPDLPFLAFLDFLAFFSFARNFLVFLSVFPSFPGISGVWRRDKSLLFWVVFLAFPKKARKGRSGFGPPQHSQRLHLEAPGLQPPPFPKPPPPLPPAPPQKKKLPLQMPLHPPSRPFLLHPPQKSKIIWCIQPWVFLAKYLSTSDFQSEVP